MKRNILFYTLRILCVGLFGPALIFSQVTGESKSIRLRVSVMDKKGRVVSGLKKENFTIKEGKTEQEVVYFSAEDEPASVAILIDVSSSIKKVTRQSAVQSVLKFAQASYDRNDYAITAFGEQIYPLTDWGSSDEENVRALNKIAEEKSKFQQTSLWDAYLYALDKLDKSKYQKKILLIFSDGEDNTSENKYKKVREQLKSSDVSVYFVGLIDEKESFRWFHGLALMDELSSFSGGLSFHPQNQKELDEVITLTALLVRQQYVLGYIPKDNPKKDNRRVVDVKAEAKIADEKKASYNVFARKNYFVLSAPD